MREICMECGAHTKATHPCLEGVGDKGGIMILGDAPSFYEDADASLFSGVAGKWLYRELLAVGIDMTQCYVTKAVKCFSPTKHTKKAMKACRQLLIDEVREVKPRYILALGAVTLETMIGKTNLSKYRGNMFEWEGAKVIPTYHPGVVIKQPGTQWEFRSDLNYFSRMCEGEWKEPKDFKWMIVDTYDKINIMLDDINSSKAISYDIECTSLKNTKDDRLLMIGIATETQCYLLPWEGGRYEIFTTSYIVKILNDIFKNTAVKKVAQNAKFDNRWLRSRGVEPRVDFDTFLASYLLNVNVPHGLKYMAKTYCGANDYGDGIEFKEDLTYEEFEAMAKYCCLDVYYTLKLYHILKDKLLEDQGLARVFKYIVMPGERVLQKIEDAGVYVNQTRLEEVTASYEAQRNRLDSEIEDALPDKWKGSINLNSPKQLGELLFTDLKLPVISVTETGASSTGKSALLRLVDYHPLPQLILKRRMYDKALNGFLLPWVDYLKEDGRIHSTYNIAKTATGRLSAEDPNLQQVPRDANVRNLISCTPGRDFIEADYSQLELRVAGYVAGAESMKGCYIRGEDLHRKTASMVAGCKPEEVTKDMRTKAKAVNFGYLYSMWWKSFKAYAFDNYGVVVSDKEAEHSRNAYFETYPELLKWHERQKREVNAFKCVRTATGRIRHLPDIDSPDKDLRSSSERKAINTPVQSFGSDITLLAMILIDQELEKHFKGKACLTGQVHDAIMAEADKDVSRDVAIMIKKCMESVPVLLKRYFGISFDVPLLAEVECGEAWGIGEIIEI